MTSQSHPRLLLSLHANKSPGQVIAFRKFPDRSVIGEHQPGSNKGAAPSAAYLLAAGKKIHLQSVSYEEVEKQGHAAHSEPMPASRLPFAASPPIALLSR